MATLQRTKLSNTQVLSDTIQPVLTCGSGESLYVRGFLLHNLQGSTAEEVEVYNVPAAASSSASGALNPYRIFNFAGDTALAANETRFVPFPATLTLEVGDTLEMKTTTNGMVTFTPCGDKAL